jgi:preprotein translocase subunit YajC
VIDPTVGLLLAPPGEDGGGGLFVLLLNFGLIFLIFYWLLIRPQKKERERHKEMIQALRKGDQVIMNGGIIGSIIHVGEDRLTIKTAENTRLEVDRSSVASKLDEGAGS